MSKDKEKKNLITASVKRLDDGTFLFERDNKEATIDEIIQFGVYNNVEVSLESAKVIFEKYNNNPKSKRLYNSILYFIARGICTQHQDLLGGLIWNDVLDELDGKKIGGDESLEE